MCIIWASQASRTVLHCSPDLVAANPPANTTATVFHQLEFHQSWWPKPLQGFEHTHVPSLFLLPSDQKGKGRKCKLNGLSSVSAKCVEQDPSTLRGFIPKALRRSGGGHVCTQLLLHLCLGTADQNVPLCAWTTEGFAPLCCTTQLDPQAVSPTLCLPWKLPVKQRKRVLKTKWCHPVRAN